MKPIETILAATDFSPGGTDAAHRAAQLAGVHGASLELLHVVPQAWISEVRALIPEGRALERAIVPDARAQLKALAAGLDTGRKVRDLHVEVGVPAEAILAAADWADLVVLGATGMNTLSGLVLGTTVRRVVTRAKRPVLVVWGLFKPRKPYRRVAVGIDFSPQSLAALAAARRIAPDAEFTLVHALDVEFEGKLKHAGVAQKTMREYREARQAQALPRLRALDPDAKAVVGFGLPSLVLMDNGAKTDLLAVGTGKRGARSLLLGSVADRIVNGYGGDFLACA